MRKCVLVLLSLPVILLPYTLLLALHCLFTGFLMETVFRSNGYLLMLALAVCALAAGACTLAVCIAALARRAPGRQMAGLTVLIKLCQIPAYLVIFGLGLLSLLLSVWGLGFIIFFVCFDCVTIALSGLVGATAALRCAREHRLRTGAAVLLGVCQFVFCVDVVTCIVLYFRSRQKARGPVPGDGSGAVQKGETP